MFKLTRTKHNPFRPGHGGLPPYLAGRGDELKLIKPRFEVLPIRTESTDNASIVLYGPRGMGKTTLLNWLKRTYGKQLVIATVTPTKPAGDLPLAKFAPLLPASLRLDEVTVQAEAGAAAGTTASGVQGIFGVTLKFGKHGLPRTLEQHLSDACQQRPRVLLVDEAHTLSVPACGELVNMAQNIMDEQRFMLVLAGTPGLRRVLAQAEASFMERAEVIGIGRLAATAARAAIREPLTQSRIAIADELLDYIAEDCQGYPFFLQHWGRELWDCARENKLTKLELAHKSEPEAAIRTQRQAFYEARYAKLRQEHNSTNLLAAAIAVARMYNDADPPTAAMVECVIADAVFGQLTDPDQQIAQARRLAADLSRHEFLWQPPASQHMTAGIPSLMAYIQTRHQQDLATITAHKNGPPGGSLRPHLP